MGSSIEIDFKINYPTQSEVIKQLSKPVQRWLAASEQITELNAIQRAAIPLIQQRVDTLILAPTGSGKTLAAFLGILNTLFQLATADKLEQKIYCVYISPLKALNNDIYKNLQVPLEGIEKFAGKSNISVAVRSGDTSSYKKSKMTKKPPHILITTPESFAISLATKKFKLHYSAVEWLIVDEIHALADNKRGVLLSLSMEWLNYISKGETTRIGLSATVAPIKRVTHYLIGERHKQVKVIDSSKKKRMHIEVHSPVRNLATTRYEELKKAEIQRILVELGHIRTLLIFTNTRAGSEELAHRIVAAEPKYKGKIAVHHGSLEKEVRLNVEDKLKKGELKAVITSTSLELGIDIGNIDKTIQISSPKTVARGLQRTGRAGHSAERVSDGLFIVESRLDLLECTAIAQLAREAQVEAVRIPELAADVLAQFIVGVVADGKLQTSLMFEMVRKSYCYRNLSEAVFGKIIEAISNPTKDEESWKYGRIWVEGDIMGPRKQARMNFMMNAGTIPEVAVVTVILEESRLKLGTVSERFSELLKQRDVFILGGKTYAFLRKVGNKIIVKEAFGRVPTIPSWDGEAIGRSWKVSAKIGNILSKLKEDGRIKEIMQHYKIGKQEATALIRMIEEQKQLGAVPTLQRITVEKYEQPSGKWYILVLAIFGKSVNQLLAQGFASMLMLQLRQNIGFSADDNGFALLLPPGTHFDYSHLFSQLRSEEEFVAILKNSIQQTELFKSRFRHTAVRGLMILKRSSRRKLNIDQQQRSADKFLKHLPSDFPLLKETEREILYDLYDVERTKHVIAQVLKGIIQVQIIPQQQLPSPFTHKLLVNANADVILLEDRQSLLLNLHQQVISKVLPENSSTTIFQTEELEKYYTQKLTIGDEEARVAGALYLESWHHATEEIAQAVSIKTNLPIQQVEAILATDAFVRYAATIVPRELAVLRGAIEGPNTTELPVEASNIAPPDAYAQLLTKLLEVRLPATLSELDNLLPYTQEKIQQGIWKLQRQNILIGGNFLRDERSYMLQKERDRIVKAQKLHVSGESLYAYKLQKLQFNSKMPLEELLKRLGPIRTPLEVFARQNYFSWKDFNSLLEQRVIYYGRFFGRLAFVYRDYVNDFIGIINRQPLDVSIVRVRTVIQSNPGITIKSIQNIINQPLREIQEAIRILEAELYIARVAWNLLPERKISRDMLQYISLPEKLESNRERSIERVLQYCFRWYGPLLIDDLIRITKLRYEDVELGLQRLTAQGIISKRELFANEFMYYGFLQDFQQLNTTHPLHNFALLHPYDPIYTTQGGELFKVGYSQYQTFQIMQNGLTCGYLEYQLKGQDTVQILNIHIGVEYLSSVTFLEKLAKSIQRVFAELFFVKFIFIEEVRSQGMKTTALKLFITIFEKYNFHLQRDYLIGGTRVHTGFTRDQIITAKLVSYLQQRSQNIALSERVEQLGKFTINQLQSISHERDGVIIGTLQMLIMKQQLFYMQNYFYTLQFLSNVISTSEDSNISEIEDRILQLQNINIGSVRALGVDEPEVVLQQLETKLKLSQMNPFEQQLARKQWKQVQVGTASMKYLQKHLATTIKLFGPLSFAELKDYYDNFQQVNQTILLLRLADLLQSGELHTLIVDEQGYYMSENTLDILRQPVKNIPEWIMLHKEESWIENIISQSLLYFSSANQLIFYKGQLYAVLKTTAKADVLIIENINLAHELSTATLRKLLRYMEQKFFKQGYNELLIVNIYNNSPQFWLQFKEAVP